MDAIEQARRYVAKIPRAVSGAGGHSQTYSVACALVNGFALGDADAWALLTEYNRTCQPPWTEGELRHKLDSAKASTKHGKPRGHLLSKSVRFQFEAAGVKEKAGSFSYNTSRISGGETMSCNSGGSGSVPSKSKAYDLSLAAELPRPIQDGTRALLRAAFEPGEGIRICQARTGDDEREVPKDSGVVLSLEEWGRKLDSAGGDPNKFMRTSDKNGIFVTLNPMRIGGSKDADVTAFRHALIEFDRMSAAEQWNLISQSRIPCTAVISSGGKSLHAWVRVDARDRREYDERVQLLYNHFAEHQRPDPKNKNPSRFSRLANCMRGNHRQELLSLKMGAESFSEWMAIQEAESDGAETRCIALRERKKQPPQNDLVGQGWIRKGGSCLIVGQSGIGKSSLAFQLAYTWALARAAFGIIPARALKSMIVQAENDEDDMSDMVDGVLSGLGIVGGSDEERLLNDRVVIVTDITHTGEPFTQALRRKIDRHRPDLVWIDPLLSFIGDDISKQVVCSTFLRNWLNPIAKATSVAWMMMHHTGKPPADPKANKHKTSTDYSYMGTGSSELTNWARATCYLQRLNESSFELKLTKRGKRAGASDISGHPTQSVFLRHAETGIHWEQIDEPVKESRYTANKGKDGRAEFDTVAFMASVGASALKWGAMIDRVREFGGVSERKASDIWARLLKGHFKQDADGFYRAE